MSLRELGKKTNIDHTTISKIENGERGINEQYLWAFADFFQVSTDYILGRTDKRPEAIKPKELFKSPYKDNQVFKDIIKIIDNLTINELHMVLGVMKAVLTEVTINEIIDKAN